MVFRWAARTIDAFSLTGLALATLFFCASLTPSLIPRESITQGILSGLSFSCGYGVGVALRALVRIDLFAVVQELIVVANNEHRCRLALLRELAVPREHGVGVFSQHLGIAGLIVVMHGQPRGSCGEACVLGRVPLHGRARVVATVLVYARQRLFLSLASLKRHFVLVVRGHVVVVVDGIPCHVGVAQLFPLVHERRATQRQKYGSEHLSACHRVFATGEELAYGASLVVVLEVDGIPAVCGRCLLACGEGVLELGERPVIRLVPRLVAALRHQDVTELKYHVEHAVLADP